MNFINVFLDRPRILFLTLAFILLAGISSSGSVPIQDNPELAKRWGHIDIFYPGATQQKLETEVVNDLEIKIREVVEIYELFSIISEILEKNSALAIVDINIVKIKINLRISSIFNLPI